MNQTFNLKYISAAKKLVKNKQIKRSPQHFCTRFITTFSALTLSQNTFLLNCKKLLSNRRLCHGISFCTNLCEYLLGWSWGKMHYYFIKLCLYSTFSGNKESYWLWIAKIKLQGNYSGNIKMSNVSQFK